MSTGMSRRRWEVLQVLRRCFIISVLYIESAQFQEMIATSLR